MTIPPSLAQPSFSQAPIETTDPNAISKTILDAKGDLISATGADTPARLAVGTDGQVLLADSTQTTGLRWGADPVTATFDAKGDLLVGTGPDTFVKLSVGSDNQVLVADSAQTAGVRWSSEQDPNAIVKSIVDAKGDLIAATANDTPARLGVGTNDQLLIADSTQSTGLKWGRPDIALGTETTGNYVAGLTGGTGVTVTGSGSEGATPTVAIGQAVGTGDTVAFGGLNVDSGTLYVDSTNNRVGVGTTSPAYALDVTGDGHLTGALTVDGILYADHIHGSLAGSLYYHVKNNSGSTINAGTPVYITGTVGSSGVAEISPSRADTAATMPAIGILSTTVAQGSTGHIIVMGALDGLNTNSYSLSQPLYVGSTGGLTNTRPTTTTDAVQVIAYASRINASTGEIIVNAYDQVRAPNSISIPGNIATTAGQFTGSGAGLTSIPAGQLTGTVGASNIGNDTVALGTKTTGDYVATLQAGTGVTVTNGSGEGVSPTVAIGQAVATSSSPQFVGLTATGTVSANAVSVTNGVGAASATITGTTATSVLTVDGIEIDTTGATSNQVLSYNGTKFVPSSPGAADANALTGTTLASNVVSSSLTSVGTLGSLSVTGDLTVDTSTLKVDSTNNRVGVNDATPSYALDVAGTAQATQFLQGTDYLTPYTGFRNAIINGDFRINQRVWSSSTATGTYGFDRWKQVNSGGTVTMSSQTFTVGSPATTGYESPTFCRVVSASQSASGDYALLVQQIEDVRSLANSTITVSFWAKAASGTPKVALELQQGFGSGGSPSADVNTYGGQATLSTSWARYSLTATVPNINGKTIGTTANTSFLGIQLWVSGGSTFNSRTGSLGIQNNTFDFWGVQVERGSVATPFEQRPIGAELALCQRYYYRMTSPSTFGTVGSGIGSLVGPNGNVDATFPLPVPMRIAPTSIGYSTLRLVDYQAAFTIASITLATIRTTPILVQATVASTSALTLYRPYIVESNNSTSGYFEATAEF